MLKVPEYLLLTAIEASADRIPISVAFTDNSGFVRNGHINSDLLNTLMRGVDEGALRFMAFNEHPRRILAIDYPAGGRRAIIKVQELIREDNFPEDWEVLTLDPNALPHHGLIAAEGVRAGFSPLRAGTLSSELVGADMRLAANRENIEAIMDALERHQPDVLLTAGHSLESDVDLDKLDSRLRAARWDGLLFAEVKNYQAEVETKDHPDLDLSAHCMLAWTHDAGWHVLGRQFFATADMARKGTKTWLPIFQESLEQRSVEFKGRQFGALICGEINALQGRSDVKALSPNVRDWLRSLDVIVNPTHDLMGNAGTLIAKRRWASRNGRVYLSASNWNTAKGQTRTSRTLHTAFINGREVAQSLVEPRHKNYEYREAYI